MMTDAHKLLKDLGMPATAVRILVQRPGHFVARAETYEGPVVLKASTEPEAMVPDAQNAALLASVGLPAPQVLAQGEDPLSYVVLRWIEEEALSSASPLRAQLEAGVLLNQVHRIDNSGKLENGLNWDEWMKGWLNVALPWWGEHEGVDLVWLIALGVHLMTSARCSRHGGLNLCFLTAALITSLSRGVKSWA